jgi:hypothetical protein
MTRLEKISSAITVVLVALGSAAAWLEFLALMLGWAGGTLAGAFRIERKLD